MTPVITLEHFQRGPVEVSAVIENGHRGWVCPNRPMMRPWPDCFFKESPEQIEALLAMAAPEFTAKALEGAIWNALEQVR